MDRRYKYSTNIERAKRCGASTPPLNATSDQKNGISFIILTKDKPEFIVPLLSQLQSAFSEINSGDFNFECIIGDTGSTEKNVLSFYTANSHGELQIYRELPYHFSKNNNLLSKYARYSNLCFLNNDIFLKNPKETLLSLKAKVECVDDLEITGMQMNFPDGSNQHCGIFFSSSPQSWALPFHIASGENAVQNKTATFPPAVTGAFMLIRSKTFYELGGFDESYEAECQDIDLCLRVRRIGGKIQLMPSHEVIHHENGTRIKNEEHHRDRSYFLRKWQSYVEMHYLSGAHL